MPDDPGDGHAGHAEPPGDRAGLSDKTVAHERDRGDASLFDDRARTEHGGGAGASATDPGDDGVDLQVAQSVGQAGENGFLVATKDAAKAVIADE